MPKSSPRLLPGFLAGSLAGLLDVLLIVAVDPRASSWVALASYLFWASAGLAVVASDSGLGSRTHGVLGTIVLNLPWYVTFGPAAGTPAHVLPLVAMSVVFGLGFGAVHARGRRVPSAPSPE